MLRKSRMCMSHACTRIFMNDACFWVAQHHACLSVKTSTGSIFCEVFFANTLAELPNFSIRVYKLVLQILYTFRFLLRSTYEHCLK